MKAIILAITLLLSACSSAGEEFHPITEEDNMKEEQTAVTVKMVGTEIPAVLNTTLAAREFIKRLPFTITVSKSEFDFCGSAGTLRSDPDEHQVGWENGDIGYNRGWFALFHSGEEQSSSYTNEMIIGHIDDSYIETLRSMDGSLEITVQLKNK